MVGVKGRSGNPEAYKYGFGSRPIEVDEEYRSRQKGVPHKFVWTKEKCVIELEECLTYLKRILRKDNSENRDEKNIKDAITMMDKILDFMRYLYPPVQQSVNVNLDLTTDAVLERLKNWKKKVFVIGEEDGK